MPPPPPGRLVLVATPIGNVQDLSPRAAGAISEADVVCCEDTRHSGQLFSRLGLRPRRLVSLHGHNEAARASEVVGWLAEGLTVALVSDAGLPGVSDPGGRVVAAAHEAGARVTAVPGPSAAPTAVALAGLGDGRWRFEGFLPRKGAERRHRIAQAERSDVVTVFYESPRRVDALLGELAAAAGDGRLVAVGRELTKLHEELWRGPLGTARGRWPAGEARGEFVLVLDVAPPEALEPPPPGELARAVEELVAGGLSRRDAVAEVAGRLGLNTRAVYDALPRGSQRGRPDAL
ncbi:MAG TPA: 16S rRNA (cytidine(1402)-2'-O)-methyltransferase [Acidimicrobiales bacterium]|nr:16S rRNA (cytidine(1402)-2'-O)-methyltransferase [Acidimicrobiales bacterium]